MDVSNQSETLPINHELSFACGIAFILAACMDKILTPGTQLVVLKVPAY